MMIAVSVEPGDPESRWGWSTRLLILLILAGSVSTASRILEVTSPFGANDYSRWATIVAVSDTGQYVVGVRRYGGFGEHYDVKPPTVDILLNPETNEFYSSKPPLLPTLMAAEARLLKRIFGWSFRGEADSILRALLLTFNWAPFLLSLVLLALLLREYSTTTLGRLAIMATACFGTFVTTFSTTITNHVVGATGCLMALFCFLRAWKTERALFFFLAGLCAGWTASHEIPAACLVAGMCFVLFLRWPKKALLFLSAALISLGAFWYTNALAVEDPLFFYGFGIWRQFEGSYWLQRTGIDALKPSSSAYLFHFLLGHHGVFSLTPLFLLALPGIAAPFLPQSESASPFLRSAERFWGLLLSSLLLLLICGFCRNLFHHHGWPLPAALVLFGLISIPCLTLPWRWWQDASELQAIARVSLFCTILTLSFYLVNTTNYGGITTGPRWVMWLTPLWLFAMVPTVDKIVKSKVGVIVVVVLLGVSIYSATHSGLNPWLSPWLYELME